MLNIHNLSISFQGEYLFEDITFKLNQGDRVGLIGKNGAGKSTMLRILSKEQEADTGQIAADKDLKIGFLKQDIDFDFGKTVLEESYEAFQEIKQLEKQLEDIEALMKDVRKAVKNTQKEKNNQILSPVSINHHSLTPQVPARKQNINLKPKTANKPTMDSKTVSQSKVDFSKSDFSSDTIQCKYGAVNWDS